MNELGDIEREEHIKVAQYAEKTADIIIFVGPNSKIMQEATSDQSRSLTFDNWSVLENKIADLLQENDLVLFKASQNKNYFEEVVKIILDPSIDPKNVLVRQGKEWAKKKNYY